MKFLFMFLTVSVFAISVNARNATNTSSSRTNTTTPSIGKDCSIGYHKVNSKCVKLYCNDLPKEKEEEKKANSSAK